MISAEGGTGKTWAMLSMMLALESGAPLFDYFPPRPARNGRCLYIALDSAPWDIGKQWVRLVSGAGWTGGFASDFLLRSEPPVRVLDPFFRTWLDEWLSEMHPEVIFLDNFRQAIGALNENDTTQMEAVMSIMRQWRDTGTAVIFSHHTRKHAPGTPTEAGRDAARGASALHDAVDFHLRLHRTPKGFRLSVEKGRDEFENWTDLQVSREVCGNGVRLRAVAPAENYALLLQALRDAGPDRAAVIAWLDPRVGGIQKAEHFADNGIQALKRANVVRIPSRGRWELV